MLERTVVGCLSNAHPKFSSPSPLSANKTLLFYECASIRLELGTLPHNQQAMAHSRGIPRRAVVLCPSNTHLQLWSLCLLKFAP